MVRVNSAELPSLPAYLGEAATSGSQDNRAAGHEASGDRALAGQAFRSSLCLATCIGAWNGYVGGWCARWLIAGWWSWCVITGRWWRIVPR